MTLYLSNRDGVGGTSLTNEEGHYRFQTQSWTGNIVMGSGDELAVTQNSPLGMSVLIGTGDFKIDTTGYSYTGWNSASLVATVSTANPSNPRKDAVVLYVDKSENTPGTANNPGIIKQMVVAGTPAGSPVAPDDTAISTAVGAGNPYIRLANVTVGTGVTQITNANIASTIVLAAPKLPANSVTSTALATGSVTTAKIADASVTAAKLDFSTQKTINTTTWTGLSYGSGWDDYDAATFAQGGYYKDITGIVYLRGVVKRVSGTGTIIATLPAGFRPLRTVGGGAYGDSGQANVQVASNGQITLVSGSTGDFIYLDRFFFFAEQ